MKSVKKTSKKIFYRTPKGPKPLSKQRPKDLSTLPTGQERLERAIAHMGLASRREAKALIKEGLVEVNGKIIRETGFGIVLNKDIVKVGNQTGVIKEAMLIYKPRGIETTKTSPENTDIHDKFKGLEHLSPIGRLDKDSDGLIIMTNDGTLTRALTKENSSVEKEYLVLVREVVTPESITKLANGIMLDKVMTKPAVAKKVSKNSFTIALTEGRKHQIRRMCDACHMTIESLTRIRIGHLKIGSMKPGFVKRISPADIELLKK
jgi:pseudouridine synthase